MSYSCNKCKTGRMEPDCQESEPEYTDTFKCNNPDCNHVAVIPSVVIICSQLFSAFAGTLLSLYLFVIHITKVFEAEPGSISSFYVRHVSMSVAGFVFILCFAFLFYKAINGISTRKKFKRLSR